MSEKVVDLINKYRPKTFNEVIGQEHVVNSVKAMIQSGMIPHMLFAGPPGCGKTTLAHVIAHELGWEIVEFNASDERGINIIREKIKKIAFTKTRKIILLDEADSMTSDAQHALRRIMEKCPSTTRFILTCNEDWKIIDPIKSRCAIFYFRPLTKKELLKIIIRVLKGEGLIEKVTPEVKKAILTLIDYVHGDARKALNMLQQLIVQGREITEENIRLLMPVSIALDCLKTAIDGDFKKAIQLLEDTYLENRLDVDKTINELYKAVKNLEVDDFVKIRLLERLADVERNIRMGCSPLIQLASFIATAWLAVRVPKSLLEFKIPIIKEEKKEEEKSKTDILSQLNL